MGGTSVSPTCVLDRLSETVRRQRQDFHHKTALALVREHDAIYHEDLQTANMLTLPRLKAGDSQCSGAAYATSR
jgi:putative transposase